MKEYRDRGGPNKGILLRLEKYLKIRFGNNIICTYPFYYS